MPTAYGEVVTHQTALKNLRRWRVIQLASVLPLMLCVVWIFYFREATGLGVMAFFLILVVGVMFPEVKGDISQIHVVLKEEHQVLHQEIQQLALGMRAIGQQLPYTNDRGTETMPQLRTFSTQ